MIATAFMGYVLPWGQMSFWGATVITNLFSAIPVLGSDIVIWLWGGYSIANATLVRFFSLHFLFPIIIAALVVLHLHLLHLSSSSNPIGQNLSPSKIFFTPYYIVKDLFGVIIFLMLFTSFVFFYPNVLGHSDNYIPANPLVTPPHIVPEWYFLPFYAVLRSIPDKLLGVIALAACIIILYFLPFISVPLIKSLKFRPIPRVVFFLFVAIALVLGWIGGCIVSYPFIQIGQIFGISYFVYFLINLPLYNYCNNTK
jgi:ubiquinol-cytochrome c reductase cytochrome b subunit